MGGKAMALTRRDLLERLGAVGGARFAAAPLLRTGERSWTESGAIQGGIAYDAGSGELPGPHDLALALTRLSPSPDRDEQRVDGLIEEYSKKFMLDYNFPPYSVGECKPIRGPGRTRACDGTARAAPAVSGPADGCAP